MGGYFNEESIMSFKVWQHYYPKRYVEKLLDYKKIYSIINICTTKQHFLMFHYREEYLHVKIRRAVVLGDVVTAFKNPNILDQALVIVLIKLKGEEEIADDFGGVIRDILSAFWNEFNKGYTCGDIEMIPCIRHDFGYDEWRAVARAIVKGYRELCYYPILLNKAFMISCVFGEHTVSEETLLQSFFNYIPLEERQIVKESLIKENISVDGDDSELLDVLSTRRVPCTDAQLKKLLLEIAHKEIIQAPSYM